MMNTHFIWQARLNNAANKNENTFGIKVKSKELDVILFMLLVNWCVYRWKLQIILAPRSELMVAEQLVKKL